MNLAELWADKSMNSKTFYSAKAEKYARYRWDYAEDAIRAIFGMSQLTPQSTLADIGAGTGILAKHFASEVQRVYAIEPDIEMRKILAREMQRFPSVWIMDGSAEYTGLPDCSVDVVTVAQAIHWFDPEPARNEMLRILKRAGWLALLRNYATNEAKNAALAGLMTEELGADFTFERDLPLKKPVSFYFGQGNFQKMTFPFQLSQNWDEFIGALTTASYMPDEDHPLFSKLEEKAMEIFSTCSHNGFWIVEGETELIIGKLS